MNIYLLLAFLVLFAFILWGHSWLTRKSIDSMMDKAFERYKEQHERGK
jgi:uncharacterized protein YneF (UPF0154 family)